MPSKEARLTDRFLEELSETFDLHATIKKLNITEEHARGLLKSLVSVKRPAPSRHPLQAGKFEIFVDGASRGNPGKAGAGAVIRDQEGRVVKKLKRYLGVTTNNMAEYQALILALEAARALGLADIKIFADSELMVKHLTGVYRVKSPDLRPLYEKALKLLEGFREFKITHVYREENSIADGLANEAIDEG